MGAYRLREQGRRPIALIGTLAVHAALLMLMLWPHAPRLPSATTPALAVFDIPLPPPPPPPEPAPPPPRISKAAPADGGAPRPALQPPAPTAAPPLPRASEAPTLPTLLTPAAPIFADLPVAAGTAASAGMTGLPASGSGRGGTGTGAGDAHGSGPGGTGTGEGMKRAAWIVMPTRREMEPYWPSKAIRDRLSGRVVLACIVPRPGPPRRCVVAEEYPRGIGFGKAALQMIHLFRLRPVMRGRTVVDMPVTIPVVFEPSAFRGLPRDATG